MPRRAVVLFLACVVSFVAYLSSPAQKPAVIPHAQDGPPGPPLTPAEAVKKMTLPPGFSVEVVAAEPDLVNPVAMTIDEKGRFWITESLEYPRHSAGPGKDRVKVLESTKGDGVYDKVTVFADGLNIPSGIAVGHGGVWVANAPDILFYKEAPDGKAAGKPEVVVTGFGRHDTHELPNSLTWGPDGWLYGLNGVFNPSVVKSNNGQEYRFTVALFRIHPKTREFQLFCEGTSNPWGVAFDHDGSAFISACVIDHLWHLTETGYYIRQGGPYPPFATKIPSIVKHKHQKAAYCGIHYFDSDAYPAEYRDKMYMGNIHGGCINCDELTRDGSTYFGKGRPDFLTANDKWFMPVVQKTGPDGCLYVLDWYDRYHCYQDANRDPAGIDRERGRLYRIRYKDTPRGGRFDLSKESDDELIQRLHSPNVYFRDLAQRLLTERNSPDANVKLRKLILDDKAPRKTRMHALFALVGTGALSADFHQLLLTNGDPMIRAWGVRAAGNFGKVDDAIRDRVASLAKDASPDVRLQVAIASRKVHGLDAVALLLDILAGCGDDKLIPSIVWQNLHPLMEDKAGRLVELLEKVDMKAAPNVGALLPRVIERLLGGKKPDAKAAAELVALLAEGKGADAGCCCRCLTLLTDKCQTGELRGQVQQNLRDRLQPLLGKVLAGKPEAPLYREAVVLAAALKDPAGMKVARDLLTGKQPDDLRIKMLGALIAAEDSSVVDALPELLKPAHGDKFQSAVLASLGKLSDPRVADLVIDATKDASHIPPARAIDLLTQRAPWSKTLLAHLAKHKVPPTVLGPNQARGILAHKDAELKKTLTAYWGIIRETPSNRGPIVAEMRELLKKTPGDPVKGMEVFKANCAKCHKIHGEGMEVGPDITRNGRSDFEQLLSNVFDPSLVIGAGYQLTVVTTKNDQVIEGIVVENSDQRVVLKKAGGELATLARGDVETIDVKPLSLMPEGLEKTIKPQEIADLFAFLCLDKPPSDPTARRIPGTPTPSGK